MSDDIDKEVAEVIFEIQRTKPTLYNVDMLCTEIRPAVAAWARNKIAACGFIWDDRLRQARREADTEFTALRQRLADAERWIMQLKAADVAGLTKAVEIVEVLPRTYEVQMIEKQLREAIKNAS